MTKNNYEPLANASFVTFIDEATNSRYVTTTDWDLIWRSIEIEDALARRFSVTVPGRDGQLDLSDALGGIYYENRNIVLEFVCVNYIIERFNLLASRIRNALDGKVCRVVLSNDSSYFWRGRPQIEAEWGGLNYSIIRVSMDAEPYKYSVSSSYDPWIWNTFSFVNGTIVTESDVVVNNRTIERTLPADRARGKPTIWLNNGEVQVKLSTMTQWLTLKSGANVFPEIRMSAQEPKVLQLKGKGTVGIDYRLGSL